MTHPARTKSAMIKPLRRKREAEAAAIMSADVMQIGLDLSRAARNRRTARTRGRQQRRARRHTNGLGADSCDGCRGDEARTLILPPEVRSRSGAPPPLMRPAT